MFAFLREGELSGHALAMKRNLTRTPTPFLIDEEEEKCQRLIKEISSISLSFLLLPIANKRSRQAIIPFESFFQK